MPIRNKNKREKQGIYKVQLQRFIFVVIAGHGQNSGANRLRAQTILITRIPEKASCTNVVMPDKLF